MQQALQLSRTDLGVVGSTNNNTLVVLCSSGPNKRDKLVVGDRSGVVTGLHVDKHGSPVEDFRVEVTPSHAEVAAVSVDPQVGHDDERVLVACGQEVHVLKRKGAKAAQFDTNQNEDIQHVCAAGGRVWTAGEYVLNAFENQREALFFMSTDKINHMVVSSSLGDGQYNAVLACRDRKVRFLRGDSVALECTVDTPASALLEFRPDGAGAARRGAAGDSAATPGGFASSVSTESQPGSSGSSGGWVRGGAADTTTGGYGASDKHFLYGTESGVVGQLIVTAGCSVERGFTIGGGVDTTFGDTGASGGGVSCMTSADVTMDGVCDIVVGRDTGTVELFSFDSMHRPQLQYSHEFGEAVTSVATGRIVDPSCDDIILSTYSGKLRALSTRPPRSPSLEFAPGVSSLEADQKIAALQAELSVLRSKLEGFKFKYQKVSHNEVAVKEQFKIRSSFRLVPEEACYVLSIEIEMPIDVLALHCTAPVMLVDREQVQAIISEVGLSSTLPSAASASASSSASASRGRSPLSSTAAPASSSSSSAAAAGGAVPFMVTFRCQEKTNRLDIKLRSVEGHHGVLKAIVVPRLNPKTSQTATFQLQPLSLHEKVHLQEISESLSTRSLNTMTLQGGFSLNEFHNWMCMCMPSVNPRLTTEEVKLYYQSSFLGTVLTCSYRKGSAQFRSDNVSAIAIVKEVITKQATARNINIQELQVDIKDHSLLYCLGRLRPALESQFSLQRKKSLIAPLREIETHNEDVSFLFHEYKQILENAHSIESEFEQAPRQLDFLRGVVTDLFVDRLKLKGRFVLSKVEALKEALVESECFDFDRLAAIFEEHQ